MKHLKLGFLPLGAMLVFAGCDLREVEVPTPISPIGSEYHNYNNGILFTWQSVDGALIYSLEIASDDKFDAMLFSDSTIDAVSCVIPIDSFQWGNTYYWRVRVSDNEWSEPVSFTYELKFDLDTTYFPFGLGYEWMYERHHYGYDTLSTWDYRDTLIIRVTDSAWDDGILHITLDTAFVLLENPVRIWGNNKIVIKGYLSATVMLIPYPVSKSNQELGDYASYCMTLQINYLSDTLAVSSHQTWEYWPGTEVDSLCAEFMKGIGTVSQRTCHIETETKNDTTHYEVVGYNLMSLTTPEGQIWAPVR